MDQTECLEDLVPLKDQQIETQGLLRGRLPEHHQGPLRGRIPEHHQGRQKDLSETQEHQNDLIDLQGPRSKHETQGLPKDQEVMVPQKDQGPIM